MVGYNLTLNNQWVQISNNEDYVLQNKSTTRSVYVAASATMPSSIAIAIELESKDLITSSIMPGIIWARSAKGTATIVYAK